MTTIKSAATPSNATKAAIDVAPAVEEDYDQLIEWNHNVLESNDQLLDAIFVYPERAIHDITAFHRSHKCNPQSSHSRGFRPQAVNKSLATSSSSGWGRTGFKKKTPKLKDKENGMSQILGNGCLSVLGRRAHCYPDCLPTAQIH